MVDPAVRAQVPHPIQDMYTGISSELSAFLLKLAHGEYDKEIAATDALLDTLSTTIPQAQLIKEGMHLWLKLNEWTAPAHVVPDGAGGYVPDTNSRYDPNTGRFLRQDADGHWYDPLHAGSRVS